MMRKVLENGMPCCAILLRRLWRSTQEAEGTGFENQQTCERAGVRIPPSPLKCSAGDCGFSFFAAKEVFIIPSGRKNYACT